MKQNVSTYLIIVSTVNDQIFDHIHVKSFVLNSASQKEFELILSPLNSKLSFFFIIDLLAIRKHKIINK